MYSVCHWFQGVPAEDILARHLLIFYFVTSERIPLALSDLRPILALLTTSKTPVLRIVDEEKRYQFYEVKGTSHQVLQIKSLIESLRQQAYLRQGDRMGMLMPRVAS